MSIYWLQVLTLPLLLVLLTVFLALSPDCWRLCTDPHQARDDLAIVPDRPSRHHTDEERP